MVLPALLERIISFCWSLAIPIQGSLRNRLEPNSVRPNHLFDPNFDHDYFFELPFFWGSGTPNHSVGDLLHTQRISGLSRVRTELLHLLVVPFLPPHPVETDRQLACHRYLGDSPFSTHR